MNTFAIEDQIRLLQGTPDLYLKAVQIQFNKGISDLVDFAVFLTNSGNEGDRVPRRSLAFARSN